MSARASVFEGIQVGVESSPGSAASASKKLLAFTTFDMDPVIPVNEVRAQGYKVPVDTTVEKEHTTIGVKGVFCFNTILYLLASGLKVGVITTPSQNGTFSVYLGSPSSGTFTLTFNGQTATGIAYTAAASAVQSALEALSTVGSGNVSVSGSAGGPYTVTFIAALAGTALALTGSGAGLTGGTFAITSTAATNARRWTFQPSMTAADIIDTLTVEKGSSVGASSCPYAITPDLQFDFGMKGAEVSAKMIAQTMADGISLTGSPTEIAIQSVSPRTLDVYVGSSILGLTKLADCFKAMWGMSGRFHPKFTLNSSQTSFKEHVETDFGSKAQIVVEQESVANAFMTALRGRTAKFCRIVMTGDTIESGYTYRAEITFPFKFKDSKRGDSDKVYAGTYDLIPIYDSTLGGIKVVVDTAMTSASTGLTSGS